MRESTLLTGLENVTCEGGLVYCYGLLAGLVGWGWGLGVGIVVGLLMQLLYC